MGACARRPAASVSTRSRRFALRVVAALWLAAALAMLVAMLVRAAGAPGGRAALAVLVPLYFMSLPAGQLGMEAASRLRVYLYTEADYVPTLALEGAVIWIALSVLGFLQWFVVLPWLARRAPQWIRSLFGRYTAR